MESCTPENANTEGNLFLDLAQYKPSGQGGYFIPKREIEIFGGCGVEGDTLVNIVPSGSPNPG